MKREVVLGIDLGTTNSVVAVADGSTAQVLPDPLGNRLIPSVVSFVEGGKILVGEEARDQRLVDAENTIYSIKRLIGRPYNSPEVKQAQERFAFELVENPSGGVVVNIRGETYTLTEISAFVLREVRRVAEVHLGHSVARAVITVPANFNELQRSATKAAGRVAGLEVARIINEPTAAALAYGYGKDRPERVAVYDLGGGTFDLTILELEDDTFEVVATAGDSFLGGDDIDLIVAEAMSDYMVQATRWDPREDDQAFERLRAAAEWVKCELSGEKRVEVTVEELGYGKGGKALDLRYQMSRAELEKRITPILGRSFEVCRAALTEAGMETTDVDNVVLVGGSTRVPIVRKMVEEFFAREARIDIDPDLVVAQGAAIHGFALAGVKKTRIGKRVALKKVSLRELDKLKAERKKRKEALPKGPAFSRPYQLDDPEIPPPPQAPPALPPTRPGARTQGSGAFVLDDPLDSVPPSKPPASLDFELDDPISMIPDSISEPPSKPKPPPPPPAPPTKKRAEAFDIGDLPVPSPENPATVKTAKTLEIGEPPDAATPPAKKPPPAPVKSGKSIDVGELAGLPPVPKATATSMLFGVTGMEEPPPAVVRERKPPPPAPESEPPGALEMAERPPPLLMDVTPHSLGLETAGGFCQHLISRNAPIPAEQSRVFTTASDMQDTVLVNICQGEERRFDGNQPLGQIELTGLRAAARGTVKIDVTFLIDASGTLDVKAADVDTGAAQNIRINLLGGADDDEIEAMRERQARLVG